MELHSCDSSAGSVRDKGEGETFLVLLGIHAEVRALLHSEEIEMG